MPGFRKRYKRFKRYYKKYKRSGKGGWKRFQKKVRNAVQGMAEHKYNMSPALGGALNNTVTPAGGYSLVTLIPNLVQGAATSGRIGDSVNMRYLRWNAKFNVTYGNVLTDTHQVTNAAQDAPDEFWVHICRPLKGCTGQNAATFATNLANYFNVAQNVSSSCMPKPLIDTQQAKFMIERTYHIKPGNRYDLMEGMDAGGNAIIQAWNVKGTYGFMKYTFKKLKGKKLKYSANNDTLPMNTSWTAVIVNNCTNANTITLNTAWHTCMTYTDI